MEHQHVRGTGTQIHCSGAAVTAPSNYNQWRLIPAFRRGMKKESTPFSLSVPTTSIMSENMCQQRGNPAHLLKKQNNSSCCLILTTPRDVGFCVRTNHFPLIAMRAKPFYINLCHICEVFQNAPIMTQTDLLLIYWGYW